MIFLASSDILHSLTRHSAGLVRFCLSSVREDIARMPKQFGVLSCLSLLFRSGVFFPPSFSPYSVCLFFFFLLAWVFFFCLSVCLSLSLFVYSLLSVCRSACPCFSVMSPSVSVSVCLSVSSLSLSVLVRVLT